MDSTNNVYWIIGLSASGKTTIANLLVQYLRDSGRSVVLLDGDVIRSLFKNDVDHSIKGRFKNAERISNLSSFLSRQGVDVVAAVLSIFPDWQKWNRENIHNYREIYLKVSMDVLLKRETKSLYAEAFAGKIKNVVGVDIPFPEPKNPDLIIDNNCNRNDFSEIIKSIISCH